MHETLLKAIAQPRIAKRYEHAAIADSFGWWEAGRYKPPTSYLHDLILAGDDTLVSDASLEKQRAPKRQFILNGKQEDGAPITYRPANDNEKGALWPLETEYLANRLGKDRMANETNWRTVVWLDNLIEIAETPTRALPTVHLSGDIAAEVLSRHDEDGNLLETPPYEVEQHITPGIMRLINELDRIAEKNPEPICPAPPPQNRDPLKPFPVEYRADTLRLIGLLKASLRCLWKPLVQAIRYNRPMGDIGRDTGVAKGVAAAVGRQRVIDGLEMAAGVRRDVARWERLNEAHTPHVCGPLGQKGRHLPKLWREAANDDARRMVA